jgi:hypothetical protein
MTCTCIGNIISNSFSLVLTIEDHRHALALFVAPYNFFAVTAHLTDANAAAKLRPSLDG